MAEMKILNCDSLDERSSLDPSEYSLFQVEKIYCFIYKNQFLDEKKD